MIFSGPKVLQNEPASSSAFQRFSQNACSARSSYW